VIEQKVTLIGVNTTSFRVFFFIIFNGYQLLNACDENSLFLLQGMLGWQPCLFVCYGGQELRQTMDGGGSDYIEKGLQNGW
jgi:hypothetical protein